MEKRYFSVLVKIYIGKLFFQNNTMLEHDLDAIKLREIRIYSPAYTTFYLETKLNNSKCVRTPNIAHKGVNIYCLCNKKSLIWDKELSFLENNTFNIRLCEYNKYKLVANTFKEINSRNPTMSNLFILPRYNNVLTLKDISLTHVPDTEFLSPQTENIKHILGYVGIKRELKAYIFFQPSSISLCTCQNLFW